MSSNDVVDISHLPPPPGSDGGVDISHLPPPPSEGSDPGILAKAKQYYNEVNEGLKGGLLDQAAVGYYPEAVSKVYGLMGHTPQEEETKKQEVRGSLSKAQAQSPYAYGAGQVVGAMLPFGLASKGLRAAGLLPEVTGWGTGAIAGGELGAAVGGARNPVNNEGNESSRVSNAVTGGIGGAIGGAVSGKLSSILSPEGAEDAATEHAIKSFDPKGSALSKLVKNSGDPVVDESGVIRTPQTLKRVAQTAYDEGLISFKPKSAQDLYDAAQEAFDKKGQELGKMVSKASENANINIDQKKVLDEIQNSAGYLKDKAGGDKYFDRVVKSVKDMFDRYGENITPARAQEIKENLGKVIPWTKEQADYNPQQLANRFVYHSMQDAVESSMDAAAKAGAMEPEALQAYINHKQGYQDLKLLSNFAAKTVGRELNNRSASLTDYMTALEGANMMGPHGAALGLLNHGLRKYGNQPIGAAFNKYAEAVSSGAPNSIAGAATSLLQNQPGQIGAQGLLKLKNDR